MPQVLRANFFKKSAKKSRKLNFTIFRDFFFWKYSSNKVSILQDETPLGLILEKTKFSISK